ncbi:MAG: hypothetical protein AAB732_00055 [Patescibacteria group bacterium]
MFLEEKLKKIIQIIIENKIINFLVWIFIGFWCWFLLYFLSDLRGMGGQKIDQIFILFSLIFLFIFFLPFFIVWKKYKELTLEKQIFCFIFSIIHILILCFIISVSIEWIYNFREQKMNAIIYNINNFIVNFLIKTGFLGALIIGFFLSFSPFYFVWKKYKKFTKKRIIFCIISTLLLSCLLTYLWFLSIALLVFNNMGLMF